MIGLKTKDLPFQLDLNLNNLFLNKYVGFGDSPIPLIYKDLDRNFPNSKFILTTRYLDSWLDSMQWLFEHGKVKWNWSIKVHIYHHIFLGTKTFRKRILEHKFADFHTDVLRYFESRPKDLLILDMEKGFGTKEICDFLQVPATQLEYPHSNKRTTTTFDERVSYEFRQRKILLNSLVKKLGKDLK